MLTFAAAFLLALALASVFTPAVASFAERRRLFDLPDAVRKVHSRAVPRLGGIAVVAAFLAPIAALAWHDNQISAAVYEDVSLVVAFFAGAIAIAALGVFDDLRGADAKIKFSVQITVALGMWAAGFRIEQIGGSLGLAVHLGILSPVVTVVWIVGVVNAVNLIDGLDGLASGLALIASVVLFVVGVWSGHVLLALLMSSLAGSLVGFLFFNFNPARIFLGDSGSLFLGFVLAVGSLWTGVKAEVATLGVLPLLALAVPLLDTTLSIVRRVARGQSPFSADREHLHHRLMALGLTHKGTVLTMYATASAFAASALIAFEGSPWRLAVASAVSLIVGLGLVRRVGLFGSMPFSGRRALARAKTAVRAVRASSSVDAAWRHVDEIFVALGCEEAQLTVVTDRGASSTSRVLTWTKPAEAAAAEPSDQTERLRLGMPFGKGSGIVRDLTVLWSTSVPPPVLAARRRALKRLHRALRDVGVGGQQSAGSAVATSLARIPGSPLERSEQ